MGENGGVLELLVENAWVVETLKALGSGHMLHLCFAHELIEPETLDGLRSGALGPGLLGEILVIGPVLRRVATFELQRANDLQGFMRFDFRLLSVAPFIRNGSKGDGLKYWCRYRREPRKG